VTIGYRAANSTILVISIVSLMLFSDDDTPRINPLRWFATIVSTISGVLTYVCGQSMILSMANRRLAINLVGNIGSFLQTQIRQRLDPWMRAGPDG
jgi:hypothetical protein